MIVEAQDTDRDTGHAAVQNFLYVLAGELAFILAQVEGVVVIRLVAWDAEHGLTGHGGFHDVLL